ncbi:syntaxin-125-like [Andrographis paniculata]|uniref:syntaxin-125-like n=1 Tax=Andrographis paniculata TaxID=175694 RepID=UPI0021E720F7|nr:syntaxin-125-like [Andrographis paniculata]
MRESFGSSFNVYVDPMNKESGMNIFAGEVDNIKADLKNVEVFYNRIQDSNEEVKEAQNEMMMKEVRSQLNADLEFLLRLAKQINKKFDGLVAANAAQRMVAGSGVGSEDDRTRAAMISNVTENLKRITRNFQGLRVQMETEHRLLIESRYSAITGEKATAEAIDNLIASQTPAYPPRYEMQEHGRGAMADALAEIQERRDTLKDIRRKLMDLHQIFLGIATPIESQRSGGGEGAGAAAGAPTIPIETHPTPLVTPNTTTTAAKPGTGTGSLNDYEKEMRKQAYIAIALAIVIILTIVISLLRIENNMERAN